MADLCRAGLLATACGALVMLSACGHEDRDEMSWARAALARNGDLEVVAADQESRTFTIRMKDSGALRMVRVDDLIAAPASASQAATGSQASVSRAGAAGAPSGAAMPPSSAGERAAASEEATASDQVASAAQPALASASASASASAGSASQAQPSSIIPQAALSADATPGKVLESGPGYTIKAAALQAPVSGGRVRETSVTNATLERRHEPIICQGARLMHIDNRNLAFDGDAVSAEEGCEIHITNSHISAGGVGVLARGAHVHIDNSLIEGDQGSIDASQGAEVYVASSRFRGLSRRLDNAAFHDLGGNVWN